MLRRDIGDSEQIRTANLIALDRIVRTCHELIPNHPSYAAVIVNAISLASGLGGCPPVTRTEVTGSDGAPVLGPDAVRQMAEEVMRGGGGGSGTEEDRGGGGDAGG